MPVDKGFMVALTTLSSKEDATKLARALVEGKLAACVNILDGARSIYRWKGRLNEDEETLMVIKTSHAAKDRLLKAFNEWHPYECPELIFLNVNGGLPSYLSWLEESMEGSPSHG